MLFSEGIWIGNGVGNVFFFFSRGRFSFMFLFCLKRYYYLRMLLDTTTITSFFVPFENMGQRERGRVRERG